MGDTLKSHRIGARQYLIRKCGVLVHHGDTRTVIDVGEFIRAQREARIRRLIDVGN